MKRGGSAGRVTTSQPNDVRLRAGRRRIGPDVAKIVGDRDEAARPVGRRLVGADEILVARMAEGDRDLGVRHRRHRLVLDQPAGGADHAFGRLIAGGRAQHARHAEARGRDAGHMGRRNDHLVIGQIAVGRGDGGYPDLALRGRIQVEPDEQAGASAHRRPEPRGGDPEIVGDRKPGHRIAKVHREHDAALGPVEIGVGGHLRRSPRCRRARRARRPAPPQPRAAADRSRSARRGRRRRCGS